MSEGSLFDFNTVAQKNAIAVHFMSLVSFYISWKRQKTNNFLMFSGDIEREPYYEMGWAFNAESLTL